MARRPLHRVFTPNPLAFHRGIPSVVNPIPFGHYYYVRYTSIEGRQGLNSSNQRTLTRAHHWALWTTMALLAFWPVNSWPAEGPPSPGVRVTLQWDPSVGAEVNAYRLYLGTSSGSYVSFYLGEVTMATLSGLTPGGYLLLCGHRRYPLRPRKRIFQRSQLHGTNSGPAVDPPTQPGRKFRAGRSWETRCHLRHLEFH